jgi:hypothetical protein
VDDVVWNAEFAETLKGKYCVVQANYVDGNDQLITAEQFHGIVVAVHPVRGILFQLMGNRAGEHWLGPPDTRPFREAPGKGKFTLSETGEVVTDPDYVFHYRFYASGSVDR